MLHQQGQCGHPSVVHYLIIIDDGDINQREAFGVDLSGLLRIAEAVEPVGGVRVWTPAAVVEQYRDDQRQFFMPRFKMTLHGGDSIAELAKGHVFIRRTLVLQKQMDVSVIAGGGFHAPENVAGVLT